MSARAKSLPRTTKSMRETQAPVVRQAILGALPSRLVAKAALLLPAVPALLDHYVEGLCLTWASLGRPVDPTMRAHLRKVLDSNLKEAFAHSPHSRVTVAYGTDPPPSMGLSWNISTVHSSIEDEYNDWVRTREPPLFGPYPDAKVMDLARTLGVPSEVAVLDIGAGTGRNSLPLARAGFRVDAVEFTPSLVTILQEEVAKAGLPIRVIEGNGLDLTCDVQEQAYSLVFLSEVVFHFRHTQQLRRLFELASRWLIPGGYLLFDAFVPLDGYKPDELARQVSEVMWCRIYTRPDLHEAASGTPLDFVSEGSTLEYERAHYPDGKWPPTIWYEPWSTGQNLFRLSADKSPIELRWLVFRKRAG